MRYYSYQTKKSEKEIARAMLKDIDASAKDLGAVCANIKGWKAEKALVFLEEAAKGNKAIFYPQHSKKKGHRKELGGRKGGYPVKSCSLVKQVLENAMANAREKNLENPRVLHAAANKLASYPRMASKGKQMRMDYETSYVEIVLG